MKPVTQSRLHDPEGRAGTCLAACLASLLEVEESAIPLRYLDEVGDGAEGSWWEYLAEDMEREFGVSLHYVPYPEYVEPRGWCIVNGKSPRGDFGHSCVGYRGQVVWDPHPSRAGLVTVTDYYIVDPVPEHGAEKMAA